MVGLNDRSREIIHLTLYWNCTAGIATDMLVYSIVIPVFPFQLERLGYSNVSSLVGWLLFAYVRSPHLKFFQLF